MSPNPALNVAQPNRSRQIRSVSGGIGAAAHKRSRCSPVSGPSVAFATRIASDPSIDSIVAFVRCTSDQNRLTENLRTIAALPPVSSVPTTQTEIALKWNSGNGVSTMSSGRRCHARAIWSASATT